jgi:hypothetical protein
MGSRNLEVEDEPMLGSLRVHARLLSGRVEAGCVSASGSEAGNVCSKPSSSARSRRCRLSSVLSTFAFDRLHLGANLAPKVTPADPALRYIIIIGTPHLSRFLPSEPTVIDQSVARDSDATTDFY